MSFIKIKDPSKRDKLVAEYLKTKKKNQDDFRSERLGEQSLYEDFGKIFKRITEQQQKSSEDIISKFAPLQEAVENIPALPWDQAEEGQALTQPELVAIDAPQIEIEKTSLAGKYLETYSQRKKDTDKSYGMRRENGKYCMGGKGLQVITIAICLLMVKDIGEQKIFGISLLRKSQKLMKLHKKIKIITWILLIKQMRCILLIGMEK